MTRKPTNAIKMACLIFALAEASPAFSLDAATIPSGRNPQGIDNQDTQGSSKEPFPASLPAGFRKVTSFSIDKLLTYDWDLFDIYLSSWHNGVQTTGDPSLLRWNSDGSATLDFRGDGQHGRSGMLKLIRPKKAQGRWGAIVDVNKPDAVAAFFLYAKNGKEVDFELTRQDGVLGWSPNVWMPKRGGGKCSYQGVPLHIPFAPGPQTLEIELDANAAVFLVNGEERARINPEDMPSDCIWDIETPVDVILSVESHGAWAGQSYADRQASMTVYAIRP